MDPAGPRTSIILSLDSDLSQLPQHQIDAVLRAWQSAKNAGVPTDIRLAMVLKLLPPGLRRNPDGHEDER
jgi:hypothetical protein